MVSVIVPVYNAEKFLTRCVESLTNQTYRDLEIILIDDGSKDKSLEVCNSCAKEDDRIHVYAQSNSGVSATRNRGIRLAKGEYIQFIDSDDYVKPEMIEDLVTKLESTGSDVAVCGCVEIHEDHTRDVAPEMEAAIELKNLKTEYPGIFENFILNSPVNKLYKKSCIQEYFPENLSLGEDLIFNLNYFKNIKKMYFTKEVYYIYEIHPGSLNRIYRKDAVEIAEKLYVKSRQFIMATGLGERALKDISRIFMQFLFYGISDYYVLADESLDEKKEGLKKWMENPNVKEAARRANMPRTQQKAACFLLKHKMTTAFHLMMMLKRKLAS